jgi:hypothetical protein
MFSARVRKSLSFVLTLTTALTLALSVSACGRGSSKNVKIDGVDGPRVNYVDGKLTMAVVLKNAQIDFGVRIPLPYMPESFLEVGPDFASNGYLINLGIASKDVIALAKDHVNELDPMTLPGGRPLPGISEGFLPGLAVQVPKLNDIVFYAGAALFGVFIPVPLPWQDYIGTFRFYDGAGDSIGNISIVGRDTEANTSGFLLLLNLRGKVGNLIGFRS